MPYGNYIGYTVTFVWHCLYNPLPGCHMAYKMAATAVMALKEMDMVMDCVCVFILHCTETA